MTDQIADEHTLPRRLEQWEPDIAAVRSTVKDLEQQTHTLIREQPIVAVLTAVGVGFLVARLAARVLR